MEYTAVVVWMTVITQTHRHTGFANGNHDWHFARNTRGGSRGYRENEMGARFTRNDGETGSVIDYEGWKHVTLRTVRRVKGPFISGTGSTGMITDGALNTCRTCVPAFRCVPNRFPLQIQLISRH